MEGKLFFLSCFLSFLLAFLLSCFLSFLLAFLLTYSFIFNDGVKTLKVEVEWRWKEMTEMEILIYLTFFNSLLPAWSKFQKIFESSKFQQPWLESLEHWQSIEKLVFVTFTIHHTIVNGQTNDGLRNNIEWMDTYWLQHQNDSSSH